MIEGSGGVAAPALRSADQRSEPRLALLVLRAGKLVSTAGEFLCILRDLSETGFKARLFHPLPAAERWRLDLDGADPRHARLIWQRGNHAGFRFDQAGTGLALLADDSSLLPRRQVRLRIGIPARLWVGSEPLGGELCDLSRHGALVSLPGPPLAEQTLVRIEADGLAPRHARVRWRQGERHGLVFHQGFSLDELAALAVRLQLAGATDSRSALTSD